MFGSLDFFVEIKRVANLKPNIMFGIGANRLKNKLSF